MMHQYTNTFIFSKYANKVLLIEKNKPAWQKGHLNGIGGKVEDNEFPIDGAVREIAEECGLTLDPIDLIHFCNFGGDGWIMNCYAAFISPYILESYESLTDEKVKIFDVDLICPGNPLIIPNLAWLVPMAKISRNDGLQAYKEFYSVCEYKMENIQKYEKTVKSPNFVVCDWNELHPSSTKIVTEKDLDKFWYDVGESLGDASSFDSLDINPMIEWCKKMYPNQWKKIMIDDENLSDDDVPDFFHIEGFLTEHGEVGNERLIEFINSSEEYQRTFWDAVKMNKEED
jgi:8-oxo-dGTP diphosphatase